MKRHPKLLTLSREHHVALKLARHARIAATEGDPDTISSVARQAIDTYASSLAPHFHVEESDLLVRMAAAGQHALVARTLAEHQTLRDMVAQLETADAERLLAFATLLEAHVRFEERELFETAQTLMTAPDEA